MKVFLENCTRLLFLFAAILFFDLSQAQVSIGTIMNPQKGALLDLKEDDPANPANPNSEKGVLFPKVSLVSSTSLKPLLTEDASSADSLKMRGMIVYNVNESADGVDVGLSVWNGEEWMSVVGGGANKAAVFTIDWANTEVNGTYIKGKSLNAVKNTITLPVTVTRTGTYNIVAYGQSGTTVNGYSFSVSGEFMTKGSFTLTLTGMGAPEESTNGNANVKDNLQFFNHHIPYDMAAIAQAIAPKTLPSVFVEDVSPEYSYNCSLIDVSGASLSAGKASTDKFITLRITVPADAEGASYEIKTNKVEGIEFSAEGTLVAGQQVITLVSNGGIIKNAGIHSFYLITNSSVPNLPTCTFDIPVIGRKIIVQAWSTNSGYWNLQNSGIRTLLTNTNLFGPNTRAYNMVESVEYRWTSASTLPSLSDVDILIVSYDKTGEITKIRDFVNGGGVAIVCIEGGSGPHNILNSTLGEGFGTSSNRVGAGTCPIYSSNSPIVKGAYMNLTGKRLGYDGGDNAYITISSAQQSNIEIIATRSGNANEPTVVRAKNKPLIVFGDGSPLSGPSSYGDYNPIAISNNLPAVKTNGYYSQGAYNAHLFVNMMVWAIDYRLKVKP